jgi:hypothetical protein
MTSPGNRWRTGSTKLSCLRQADYLSNSSSLARTTGMSLSGKESALEFQPLIRTGVHRMGILEVRHAMPCRSKRGVLCGGVQNGCLVIDCIVMLILNDPFGRTYVILHW